MIKSAIFAGSLVLSRVRPVVYKNHVEGRAVLLPAQGSGEPTRLILAHAGVKFEDHRISKDDWPAFKPKTPFGQLPLLVIDGKQYSQSLAVARYLGHKYNLAGNDIEESYEIDKNVDFFYDIRMKSYAAHTEADEAAKAKKRETLAKDYYPTALAKLDEIITKNNGYMALGKLTWADFLFAGLYEHFRVILDMPDLDQKYPSFKKIYDTVYALPKVKEFSDKAPKSEYGY